MNRYIYIVIQMKLIKENKYRAFVAKRSLWDNICNIEAEYSGNGEEVIAANILPKQKAYEIAERWNTDFKISGKLYEF